MDNKESRAKASHLNFFLKWPDLVRIDFQSNKISLDSKEKEKKNIEERLISIILNSIRHNTILKGTQAALFKIN